jgi:hypothetical protein
MPTEMTLKYSDSNNDGQADDDFEKRVRMAELLLKEQELQMKQDASTESAKAKAEAELIRQLTAQSEGEQQPMGDMPND